MARVAVQEDGKPAEGLALSGILASLRPRRGWGDRLFHGLTRAAALTLLAVVLAMVAVMTRAALPSLRAFGWRFLVLHMGPGRRALRRPAPHLRHAGVLAPGAGDRRAPRARRRHLPGGAGPAWLRQPVAFLVELLAAMPSVVYGLWGIFVLAPAPADLGRAGPRHGPRFLPLFQGPPYGIGMLAAGLILPSWCCPSSLPSAARCSWRCRVPSARPRWRWAPPAGRPSRGAVLRYASRGLIGAILLGAGARARRDHGRHHGHRQRPEISASLFAPAIPWPA